MHARIARAFDRFLDVRTNGDAQVAQLIADMDVDIAVDLMGFTEHCRPGIFAFRPAPVQVNYLGFPGTMGADYIDYIIADRFVLKDDHQRHFAEQVVYLPDCYLPNDARPADDGAGSDAKPGRIARNRLCVLLLQSELQVHAGPVRHLDASPARG